MPALCDAAAAFASSEALTRFLLHRSRSTASEQRVFNVEQAIVTTKVCTEVVPRTGAAKGWFRWAPAGSSSDDALGTCSPGGAPKTPRGSLSTMLTGVHGGWRESQPWLEGEAKAGIVVPCEDLQQRRLRPHDYCLPMAPRFSHAPPEETHWWRGVALVGNELHIDNFHHFNRGGLAVSHDPPRSLAIPLASS